jgi:hypothetical protein
VSLGRLTVSCWSQVRFSMIFWSWRVVCFDNFFLKSQLLILYGAFGVIMFRDGYGVFCTKCLLFLKHCRQVCDAANAFCWFLSSWWWLMQR